MTWLLPWFLTVVCVNGQGVIEPPRTFGPFESIDEAKMVMSFLAYAFLCDTGPPERGWRWKEATPINIPPDARQP